MEDDIASKSSWWSSEDERSLRRRYARTRRFNLDRASQEKIAWYMCSSQGTVAEDESETGRWQRVLMSDLLKAIARALLVIGAREDQALDFWHEVNKSWVAAGHKGSSGKLVECP